MAVGRRRCRGLPPPAGASGDGNGDGAGGGSGTQPTQGLPQDEADDAFVDNLDETDALINDMLELDDDAEVGDERSEAESDEDEPESESTLPASDDDAEQGMSVAMEVG